MPSQLRGFTDKELEEALYLYTGLAYNEEYAGIISSVRGQIYDGIGEGSGREAAIFRHYFEPFATTHSLSKNGELVIYNDGFRFTSYEVEQLVRCIWRIAQIERKNNGKPDEKNISYDYLDGVSWSAICKLNGKLNAIAKEMDKGTFKNEPWTEEKAQENRDGIEAKKKATEEEKARKEAEEKDRKEQREIEFEKFISSHEPDAKDRDRAYNAWQKTKDLKKSYGYYGYYDEFSNQRNLIKDDAKLIRRTIAFYDYLKNIYDNFPDSIPENKKRDAKQMLYWFKHDIEEFFDKENKKMNESVDGITNDELYAMGYDEFKFGEDPNDYEESENSFWAQGWMDAENDYEEEQALLSQPEEDEANEFLANDYNELYESIIKENEQ